MTRAVRPGSFGPGISESAVISALRSLWFYRHRAAMDSYSEQYCYTSKPVSHSLSCLGATIFLPQLGENSLSTDIDAYCRPPQVFWDNSGGLLIDRNRL